MFNELNQNTEHEPEYQPKYQIEVIEKFNEKILKEILSVEQSSFPEEMQSDIEDLKETLENRKGIHIIAKDEKGNIVSYLSSKPLTDAYEELSYYDPELRPEEDVLYIESIATKPESRGIGIFLKILKTLKEKAEEKRYKKITAHVRVKNNLSHILQKKGAKKLRTIENWHYFGEPFDYLEIEI